MDIISEIEIFKLSEMMGEIDLQEISLLEHFEEDYRKEKDLTFGKLLQFLSTLFCGG